MSRRKPGDSNAGWQVEHIGAATNTSLSARDTGDGRRRMVPHQNNRHRAGNYSKCERDHRHERSNQPEKGASSHENYGKPGMRHQ
ncbi:hypothetical protein [Paenarthrobacter sp. TA1.8]|uniref:hypothetical protein n=1 Tax=Paenarthrobacter sp. TA1.8 TaxID=3400219 RepID=UPI003B437C8D